MSVETLLESLLEEETEATLLAKLYAVLSAVDLDVESFAEGDPTRSEVYAIARTQEAKESIVTGAIRGGFTDTAEDAWLDVCVQSLFDVERRGASYATCTVRYTNGSSQLFTIDPEEDTARNSTTGATYRNTGATPTDDTLVQRTLAPGGTLDLIFAAEVAGSDSNATTGEIDELVTGRAGVTIANITAAVAVDEERDDAYRARGKGKLSALSPNGPKGAYDYVVQTPDLNGGANVTRSRTFGNSTVGAVTVYVANASGAVSGGDVTLCQTAVETYCEPLTIGATVASAVNKTIAVTYSLWVYDSINLTTSAIEALVSAALSDAIASRDIGGDIIPPALTGTLYKSFVEATILRAVHPHGFRVSVTTPSGDTAMAIDEVAVLGTVTATAITLIEAP